MFIGRGEELNRLQRMYQSNKLEVAIIYGRRRVGKTTLINEFCKGKKTIFFAALESNAEQNLESLSDSISQCLSSDSSARIRYRSFNDALTKVAEIAKEERLILVIDEYPYLAQAEHGISSLLQNFIDHQFKDTRLFVILCGSSMSFMENQVLGYKSPLYGRRTAQFKVMPFDYRDTGKWFPEYSYAEKAIMYGVTGGIPMYLEQFSPESSVRDNLLDGIFSRNAVLFEEPANLLKQELREPATYNAIISAIASGKSKLSEISSTTGLETGNCTKYISNLISLGIVKREVPVTEQSSRRPIYLIADQYFRFWYSFVPQNMAAIMSGRIEQSFSTAVENRLNDYMGLTFEAMCQDYIMYYDDDLPFDIGAVGQWWGSNPKTHKQAQIDIVVTSADRRRGIIGSCKFRNQLLGVDEYDLMKEYADAMGKIDERFYYFFSKSGFADSIKKCSSGEAVRLITIEEMYGM